MAFGDGELEHTLQETWVRGVERYSSCQETENTEDVTKLGIFCTYHIRGVESLSVLPCSESIHLSRLHTTTSRSPVGMKTFVRNGVFATSGRVAKMKRLSIL
jgi:hypothetical protein